MFLITIVVIIYLYNRRKNKDMYDISKMIEQVSYGKYSLDLDLKGEDELSILKDNLYKITLKLKEEKTCQPLNIEIKKISALSEVKEKKKASKEVVEVDESLLQFGTDVHALLESLDLSKKDTSYIKDYKFRKIANNVINSELFKGVANEQVRHEFSYYDKDNNVNGVIDCLIIKDNEIDIIDFKLKNIAEEDYDKQLKTYKTYISSISDKPIKMYLLAALTGEIREVKDE